MFSNMPMAALQLNTGLSCLHEPFIIPVRTLTAAEFSSWGFAADTEPFASEWSLTDKHLDLADTTVLARLNFVSCETTRNNN